jgi:hypothetical protein
MHIGLNALRLVRRSVGIGATVYPAKSGTYSQNFSAVADATTLRSLTGEGWSAINSALATTSERDSLVVSGGALTRNATGDFATRPGKFIVGRDAGSTDHVFQTKMTTIPGTGNHFVIVFAATTEANCAFVECTNSAGVMGNLIIQKNVAGVVTQLTGASYNVPAKLGRNLTANDVIRINVRGQKVHLYVNGIRITPAGGADLDTGSAFTKGSIVGFGTRSGTGVVFDDVYSAPLTAYVEHATTSLAWANLAADGTSNVAGSFPIFWPGKVGEGRSVPLAFTYTGTVSDIDYRVVNGSTSTLVQDWQRVPTGNRTLSAGNGTASVQVPLCDTTTNPTVRVDLRAANDTDATDMTPATTVGRTMAFYGQSNSAFRGGAGLGTLTPFAYTNAFMWASASKVWQGGTGASASNQALITGHTLAAITGHPWAVFVGGVGSQSIDNLIGSDSTYLNGAGGGLYWDDLLIELQSKQTNAYGYIEYVEWTQGENESGTTTLLNAATKTTDYRGKFDTLLSLLRGGPMVSSTAPVGVCVTGQFAIAPPSTTDAISDANWSLMREILFGLKDKTNVVMSSGLMDLQHKTSDEFHLSADSFTQADRRSAQTAAKALGYSTYDGRGPFVASNGVTRAGSVITLNLTANGATGFDQTTAGNLDGYDVYLASDVSSTPTLLTKSSTVLDAANSKITITLAADPGAAVKVRSFWGHWPERDKAATPAVNAQDITAIRARGTYADGTTIPVEPIYSPITSN